MLKPVAPDFIQGTNSFPDSMPYPFTWEMDCEICKKYAGGYNNADIVELTLLSMIRQSGELLH